MQPTISFVLPAYKRQFLAEAIQSILSQTYRNFDLVIVNDGSPDDLSEIVAQFSDSRIRYYENSVNLGGVNLTNSWNHALSFTNAEYVILASDDDVYDCRYLQEMISLVVKYPACDLFHCRLRYVDERGCFKFYSAPALEYETCVDFIYQRLFNHRRQTAPEFMFRRKSLMNIGGFISFPLAWYSDDATWNALSVKGVACAKEALLNFRMSGTNLSTAEKKCLEKLEALYQYKQWLSDFLNQVPVDTEDDRCILEHCKRYSESVLNSHLLMYFPYLSRRSFFHSISEALKKKSLSWKSALKLMFRRFI